MFGIAPVGIEQILDSAVSLMGTDWATWFEESPSGNRELNEYCRGIVELISDMIPNPQGHDIDGKKDIVVTLLAMTARSQDIRGGDRG